MNMIRSAKNQIAELTAAAYRAAVQEGLLPEGVQTIPAVEIPKDTANGDYTTTFCLAAAKALKKNQGELDKLNNKLGNPGFLAKAPENVVKTEQERAEKLAALIAQLEQQAASL